MKKIYTLCTLLALSLSLPAQLAWDTEFKQADFNNAQTIISKTENVSWNNGVFGAGAHLEIGKITVLTPFEDECVMALPEIGIPDKLYFSWQGASNGSISIFQSPDHNTWSLIFSTEGNTIALNKADSASLASTTRYIKFAATGRTAAAISGIRVSELKSLSVGLDEWAPAAAMVDDPAATKNVTVSWTNIVASVTSTDHHFYASVETVGQKNLVDQKTTITLYYSHAEAGTHSGEIILAGEGREARIAVSGTTSKYDQTLTWSQTLTECIATDELSFNAFASSGLEVQYRSSDSTVAVAEGNVLHIYRSGTVTLTAEQAGNYKFNPSNSESKTLIIRKANPAISVSAEDIAYGQPLSEAVLHEHMGIVPVQLAWENIATDTLLDAGDYVLSLLFTPADTGIYNLRSMPVALHFNKAVQTIVWENQDTILYVGTPAISTATLSSGLEITYAYTSCLLAIEQGVIYPENEGEVTVVAYHPGNNNYLPTTVVMMSFAIEPNTDTPTTGVMQLTDEQLSAAEKIIRDGKVYISFGGRLYDATGRLENTSSIRSTNSR